MTLRCPKASRTQSIAALFLRSGLTPSADAKIATASKKTEGAPDSAMSAGRCFPDFSRTPPIFGATMASSAPSFSSASRNASSLIAVGAVGDERADLPPLERRLRLADERERGRRIKIDRRLVGRDFRPFAFHADRGLDRLRQCFLNQREMAKHPAPDDRRLNLRELEGERVLDVPLFGRSHRAIELARLAVMIGEALGPNAQLLSGFVLALLRGEGAKAALGILARAGGIEAVGLIGDSARIHVHPTHAVAL